jgi:predicted CopG family antitoxin
MGPLEISNYVLYLTWFAINGNHLFMNQTTPKAKTVNTQSIRLPMDVYEKVAKIALEEDTSMTAVILRLINFGLGHHLDFEQAVRQMFFRYVTQEEVKDLANGKFPIVHS